MSQLTEDGTNDWSIIIKSQGYNVYDRINILTIQPAVKIVSSVLTGIFTDVRGKRWEAYLAICALWISGLAISVVYDVTRALQFNGYSISGVSAAFSVIIVSWANKMSKEDD